MKQVLLDTSFIITCIKQKIDFFEELIGYDVLIPKQVIKELEGLDSKLALRLLEKNKFKKIDLRLRNVDEGIKNYAKKNKNIIVATLDGELKKNIKNKKLVIRFKKRLEVI
ncbi:Fcf1 [archaeon BMS3Abin17]|nr:Fcf1 [archaeon BMS3Abin17]HDZ60105.1 ribonuclease VapC [Candidatus Pacearchaeota archaeon]